MRDKKLQKQKRKQLFSGGDDIRARVEYLTSRRSQGVITTEQLELAAYLGDEAAVLVVGNQNPPYHFISWIRRLETWKEAALRSAIISALAVIHLFEEQFPEDKAPREAILAAISCLYANKEAYENVCTNADRTGAKAHAAARRISFTMKRIGNHGQDDMAQFYSLRDAMNAASCAGDAAFTASWVTETLLIPIDGSIDSTYGAAHSASTTSDFSREKIKQQIIDSLLPWALGEYDPLEEYRNE